MPPSPDSQMVLLKKEEKKELTMVNWLCGKTAPLWESHSVDQRGWSLCEIMEQAEAGFYKPTTKGSDPCGSCGR